MRYPLSVSGVSDLPAVARIGTMAWDGSLAASPRKAFSVIDAERLWLYGLCLSAMAGESADRDAGRAACFHRAVCLEPGP